MRLLRIKNRVYMFPPDPETNDPEVIKNWEPIKLSLWKSLVLIIGLNIPKGRIEQINCLLNR